MGETIRAGCLVHPELVALARREDPGDDGFAALQAATRAGARRPEHRAGEGARRVSERPVVVLGLLWAGLTVARSLGRAGVPVTGIAYQPTDFGVRSRHLRRRAVAAGDAEVVLRELRAAGRLGRPILVPERDESVQLVLDRWEDVRELADLPLADEVAVVNSLRRKDEVRGVAERARVPLPATIAPSGESDVLGSGLRPPYLVKPVTGQEFAYTFGEKLFVADDLDGAAAAWRRARDHGFETVVQ